MDDLISRQAAVDAIKTSRYLVDAMEKIIKLPSTQPEEAIPVAWLEEQAKWFESIDNAFAKIEANNIRVMIKKWRRKNG